MPLDHENAVPDVAPRGGPADGRTSPVHVLARWARLAGGRQW
jgi:hypothetical protein